MMLNRLADYSLYRYVARIRFGAVLQMLVLAFMLELLTSCASISTTREVQRVLFVGNSVIYTNNLPAVFGRIAGAQQGAPVYNVDMFARGGATLTELGQDPRAIDLLTSGRYDVVVFQERGGDDLCVLMQENRESSSCRALIDSHVLLATLAREHGAKVLYLGTYQLAPGASKAIVRAERTLGTQMAAQYVEVSERLRSLRESYPELPWLHTDGGHPGVATTALMGVLIYKALNGNDPVPFELCLDAEMYTPKWKHNGVVRYVDTASDVQQKHCPLSQLQMRAIAQGAAILQPELDKQTEF